jgi:hypothetical protein
MDHQVGVVNIGVGAVKEDQQVTVGAVVMIEVVIMEVEVGL